MKAKIRATAQKLVNLYRQAHVIVGEWATVNPIFINEADDAVIQEISDFQLSAQNMIDTLLPYGGMMAGERIASINLTPAQWAELEQGIENFIPTQDGLNAFTALNVVNRFGEEWQNAITSLVQTKPQLHEKWVTINHTFNAYRLWNTANEVISQPLTDRVRAQVQSDMPEYETYLPMFGDSGNELLNKLRTFIAV